MGMSFFERTVVLALTAIALLGVGDASGQTEGWVRVRVSGDEAPLVGVQVTSGGTGALTNQAGEAMLRLPAGVAILRFERIGFRTDSVSAQVIAGDTASLAVTLEEE